MSYIGKTPTVGNFQVCDAISVVNNQAAYTMQVGSVNVSPESANHMLVSLNGILQRSGSSFTVSGSTITFASNLVTGDVINFIQILGNVLDLGVPSDGTVTSAKITYPLTTFSSTGIDDNADALAMTIDSSEKVLINKTSAGSANVGAEFSSSGSSMTRSGGTPLIINRTTNFGELIKFRKDNSDVGKIDCTSAGIGIYLGGTAAANNLDDYEEGSWTPANPNFSLTEAYGRYTKIGNLVTIRGSVVIPNNSDSNQFTLSGLPFTVSNTDANVQGNISLTTIGTDNAYLVVIKSNTTMRLVTNTNSAIANSAVAADFINFSVAYTV
jgi:hypothetical protein